MKKVKINRLFLYSLATLLLACTERNADSEDTLKQKPIKAQYDEMQAKIYQDFINTKSTMVSERELYYDYPSDYSSRTSQKKYMARQDSLAERVVYLQKAMDSLGMQR